MRRPLVLAIDQGTGSTKAIVVDSDGLIVSKGQCAIGLATPQAGWVEQDPEEIWESVRGAIASAVTPELARDIAAAGLATQRESCVIWDRASGRSLTPLLSWQDQRTLSLCQAMPDSERQAIRSKTGLPLDPMFSAVKAKWLLDMIDPGRSRSRNGDLCIGTIDSFLVHRMGGGHVVEIGNASRTQLMDLETARFDDDLLELFGIPAAALPAIVPSMRESARVKSIAPLLDGTPVTAVLADSHAALFAHGVFEPGKVKATQGTGSSIMGLYDRNVRKESIDLGVCRTIAWQTDEIFHAFEGNIRSVGSTLVWLAGLLDIGPDELATLAGSVPDSGGVSLVPAFGGLGSPYWDAEAVGIIGGIMQGTSRAQIARASVESISHQIVDVLDSVRASGLSVERLYVDGGPTKNDLLMQFEADMAGVPVVRPRAAELSALGAAYLAGIGAGIWRVEDLPAMRNGESVFSPEMENAERQRLRTDWRNMVARSRGLAVETGAIGSPQDATRPAFARRRQ